MTLPASGNPISISQINTEFSLGNSLSAYRGVTWWTDAGGTGTFDSTNLDMSEFYSKRVNSPFTVSLATLNGTTTTSSGDDVTIELYLNTNGTWTITGYEGQLGASNWGTPTTAGIGSSYWVRFTRTTNPFAPGIATASTGWLQLSSNRGVGVYNPGAGGVATGIYTIEISTNSGGTAIVATATNVSLQAFNEVVQNVYSLGRLVIIIVFENNT